MTENTDPEILDLAKKLNQLTAEQKREVFSLDLNPTWIDEPLLTDLWQVFTLEDAYEEREPVQYVAQGLFALPSLNIPYGAPGTLKSFLFQDLALCVAAGVDWLPPAPWIGSNQASGIHTLKTPTMWLDFDNGRRRTHDRFGALGRARELLTDVPFYYYSMPSPWLDASDKTSIGTLNLRIQDKGAKLVVVDNLGVVSGNAEENSREMGKVMSQFRQLAEDTGAAVVLIHHQRKSSGNLVRAGETLRGHSSIEAALDLGLLMNREDYSDVVTLRATKMRGADVLPFSAKFTYKHDERGELKTAKFFGIAALDNKSGAAIEREIISILQDTSMNKTDLVNATREALKDEDDRSPGINRIRDMIDRLVMENKLKESQGERTELLYSLQ